MRKWIVTVALAGIMLLGATSVSLATVLSFDDFFTNDPIGTLIESDYGGLSWDNFYVKNTTIPLLPSGYVNGTVSGTNVAYNGFGMLGVISTSPFDFTGAYLTGAWNNGLNIEVRGYSGGILRYDQAVVVDSTTPVFFRFDYTGIDMLTFDSFGGINAGYSGSGTHFALDDFTFNELFTIPEPGTALLLGAGLVVVAYLRGYGSRQS